jgi:hypothetical protein
MVLMCNKKYKKYILMYFQGKNILKNNIRLMIGSSMPVMYAQIIWI